MLRRYATLHLQNLLGAAGRLTRQPFATSLTVLVIAIALALPGGLRVLVANAEALSGSWESAADFSVYLQAGVGVETAKALAAAVEKRGDVAAVTLITSDEALAEFRERSGFGAALEALDGNPLPHALVVRPADAGSGVEALAAALRAEADVALVQLDTEWVARLRGILELAGRLVDLASVLLGLAVVVVIGNTIRLEINNRRDEIEVTKLVGGSDAFIRRPFLYLGLCYGLAGGIGAALLIGLTLVVLGGPVRSLAALYGSDYALVGLRGMELLILLGGGALLGWAGAGIATARHLRAIEPK